MSTTYVLTVLNIIRSASARATAQGLVEAELQEPTPFLHIHSAFPSVFGLRCSGWLYKNIGKLSANYICIYTDRARIYWNTKDGTSPRLGTFLVATHTSSFSHPTCRRRSERKQVTVLLLPAAPRRATPRHFTPRHAATRPARRGIGSTKTRGGSWKTIGLWLKFSPASHHTSSSTTCLTTYLGIAAAVRQPYWWSLVLGAPADEGWDWKEDGKLGGPKGTCSQDATSTNQPTN
ncbi:hypothetical protein GGR56DRAFT_380171 [Xylariaceae sp. FL0804]|nr:hypothetical protein GGR56DRAFT_380171 [Xylariaceae sp. FL0804]